MESIKIPTKVEEALKNPKWVEAMQIEMDALQKKWHMEHYVTSTRKKTSRMQMDIHAQA